MVGGKNTNTKKHPYDTASFLSILAYWFMFPIYKRGKGTKIDEDDFYNVPKFLEMEKCGNEICKTITDVKNTSKKLCIIKVLYQKYKFQFLLIMAPCLGIKIIKSIYHPLLVGKFISYFKPNQIETTLNQAFIHSLELMALEFFYQIISAYFNLASSSISIKIRVAISSVIYKKVLRISNAMLTKISVGNVISLMTKDVAILERGIKAFMDFTISLIQLIMTCVVLYVNMGVISLLGIGFMFLVLSLEALIGKYVANIRIYIDYKTGERLKATKECLASLKVVKMLSLESFFLEKISHIRRLEVNGMLKDAYAKSLIQIMGSLTPDIMVYIFVISYVYLQINLEASLIFYIMSCVRSVRMILTFLVPMSIGAMADFKGSVTRINRMLNEEEMIERNDDVNLVNGKATLVFKDFGLNFGEKNVISNSTLEIKTGINSIIGGSGSGKTALLLSILREFPSEGFILGFILRNGQISYASQEPWLFPGTIKENIIFGEEYDIKKYHKILKICGLEYDILKFQDEDDTQVINNGSNISKGQQCRINLARAIYKDSDIYLLDDCLASLDKNIQYTIVNELVLYLKNKICLIVTQNDHLLQNSDHILSIVDTKLNYQKTNNISKEQFQKCLEETQVIQHENGEEIETEYTEKSVLMEQKNPYSETQYTGRVSFKCYLDYLKLGRGYFMMIFIIILFGASQYAENNSTKNLTKLIDIEQQKLTSSTNSTAYSIVSENSTHTTKIYSILLLLAVGSTFLKILLFYDFTKTVSITVNKKLTKKILNSTMEFIDSHLLGSILNRFSQDLNNIDEVLPLNLVDFFRILNGIIGIFIMIVIVHYKLIVPILALSVILGLIWIYCVTSTRNLKRLETATRSPFIGHINATVDGIKTIRAHGCQNLQSKIFEQYHNVYMSSYYSGVLATLGYLFYMNMSCFVVIYAIVWSFMFILTGTSAGNVGLILVELFSISRNITTVFKTYTDSEIAMTSFERIMEYTNIKQEDTNGVLEENCFTETSIKFKNVSMGYNKLPVLNDINLNIEPKQKIGIIGKSGSGKSSMLSLLMRLYKYDGDISIDNVNIKDIPLEYLRNNIDVIPQDPTLFSDSVRNNLDPFKKYTDDKIWETINKLKIKNIIPNLYQEIDSSKYSSGEKQLICLARAMLRDSKILVMDEATAHVDLKIERFLKSVIEEHFSHCTIISIAHKLNSLKGYDRIFRLENGCLTECDAINQ